MQGFWIETFGEKKLNFQSYSDCRRTVGSLLGEEVTVRSLVSSWGQEELLQGLSKSSRGSFLGVLGTRALSPHILPPWAAG